MTLYSYLKICQEYGKSEYFLKDSVLLDLFAIFAIINIKEDL